MANSPLADLIRPTSLEDVVGQKHILGKDKLLYRLVQSSNVTNMIFYGPSGTGKTTVANIIAAKTGKKLYKLNATTASVSDIREIVSNLNSFESTGGVLLYLDEIQNFNKKQQQSLLEFTENGQITLIASTTENPYFYIYNAILSRSNVFEFKSVPPEEIKKALLRGVEKLSESVSIKCEEGVIEHIAAVCGGDVRKALNSLELCVLAATPDKNGNIFITADAVCDATGSKNLRYDKDGDNHYDILSAFQKSIRGSDANASLHYLARILESGDLISACRRLLVIASEDIGLAYPMAGVIVKSCVDSALQLGLPEGRIPLSQAVILLATAPKSNSAICAIDAAFADLSKTNVLNIPSQLQDSHYSGAKKLNHGENYLYPHSFENHYVKQQYLPDAIKNSVYYTYGDNKAEQAAKAYWDAVKSNKSK